jgi:hypothetical protein
MSCNLNDKYKFEQACPCGLAIAFLFQDKSSGCPFAVELVSWLIWPFPELPPFYVARKISVGSFGKARS